MAAIIAPGAQSRYRLAYEREFYKYIPREHSTSHYAPFDRASGDDFTPQPSRDSALTAYAQLAAIRLDTDRAFISMFDRTHQHVLAEATPTLSLIGGRVANEPERLVLGCCVLPKERGICHYVESTPSGEHQKDDSGVNDGTLVVLDVSKDKRFKTSDLQAALSGVRFYTAVPIISPRGLRIGALSVMDSKARSSGPSQHSLQFMKDMAATVMEHLVMKETTLKSHRAERMIVGLGSFVEGRSTLRDSWHEAHAQHAASERSGQSTEGQLDIEQQDLQELAKETGQKTLAIRESSERVESPPMEDSSTLRHQSRSSGHRAQHSQEDNHIKQRGLEFSQEDSSVRAVLAGDSLRDDSLPNSIRNVFSRAANLLRESIGAEGVMFLDANSQRFGSLVDKTKRRVSGFNSNGHTSSSDESTSSGSSSRRHISDTEQTSDPDHPAISECLGFSNSRVSSINDEQRSGDAILVPEPLFTSLIRRYPRGKIFTYNAQGSVSEDSDRRLQKLSGSENEGGATAEEHRPSSKRRNKPRSKHHADDLIKIFAGARNILILPIWDSDRRRWFAGTLIWTNEPDRIFTTENELVYTSAFANSIMAEIRRVDVEVAEKSKTNLISSITHELRNPLHGILGTADILSDTAMNALQHGMVHTVESCGRTLLDTINSLLDLTFIDQYRKGDTSQKGRRRKNSSLARSMPLGAKSSISQIELDAVLEEVVECVFAGYCFYNNPQTPPPALAESSSRSAGQPRKAEPVGPQASQVTVIFDIEPDTEWDFDTHAGAWRRILMNIFGNALKYTQSGYIYLGLKSSKSSTKHSRNSSGKQRGVFDVTITVKDTGKGIGPAFLHNDLFSPFKQEDPLASGSGLGLSIVRQAVAFLGGSIEIQSTKGSGTQISIQTPLIKSLTKSDTSSSNSFLSLRKYTEEKTIAILGFGKSLRSQRDTALYSSLERVCRDWFGLKVTNLSPLEGKHKPYDFYLAVQTELDCEDTGGRNIFDLARHFDTGDNCTSPVIVICQSPEEAHRMFVASKGRSGTEFFEFVSQPCGPRKIARAMNMCIKRQRDRESGRRGSEEPTRWVEVPQSSHLPVDIEASDSPEDRMKISKRPTAETMGTEEDNSLLSRYLDRPGADREHALSPALPSKSEKDTPTMVKPSVLLVDDNDVNLQLLCAYVRKSGFEYKTAKDGAQAVETYKAHPGLFKVVIIDISMPVMDGFEASREIRRLEKDHIAGMSESEQQIYEPTIIAALTGLDSAGAQKEALGSGINTFLVKPVKRAELQAILKRQV
ncbi:uncharacterized protein N7500_009371 [Penicillium coprophilum]|uniref:uncharacterized protein n=1 Tax=Penicillium coprophilum TaxID=36646 RepID=UPI0023882988|nr:uncharacterized protein N7500_009371 [Penicillium coprophilum]KAJ5153932.1 hypothetical protein N7500_009371 [Penicillium coprophilum]